MLLLLTTIKYIDGSVIFGNFPEKLPFLISKVSITLVRLSFKEYIMTLEPSSNPSALPLSV